VPNPASGLRLHDPQYELADVDEIRALQVRKLRHVLRTTWATNPFFREHWGVDFETIDRIDSLETFAALIPMVEKADFIADQEAHPPFGKRLAAIAQAKERVEWFTTSGTSGQGKEIHALTNREMDEGAKCYAYRFRWAGLDPGDRVMLTLPISMFNGGREELRDGQAYGLAILPVGSWDAPRKVDVMRRFRPRALFGSPSYFAHLRAVAGDEAWQLGVEVLLTGAEGAARSVLEALERDWEAKVYDGFGCTQLRMDFLFTCEVGIGTRERPGLLHNIDPYMLTEVLDPATGKHVADGEFGELVVTSLYHTDNPMIRCRLRDGAVYHSGAYCQCGRPFGGVEVAGITRTDDMKKIKGVMVSPQVVEDALFSFDEVDEYRVMLRTSADHADIAAVKIMTKGPTADPDLFLSRVVETLRTRVGIGFEAQLSDDLPRSEYKARRWDDERGQP
jgi:phenylacetate-CoA ligase